MMRRLASGRENAPLFPPAWPLPFLPGLKDKSGHARGWPRAAASPCSTPRGRSMPITVENCAFFLRTSVPMCLWWNAAHGLRNWYSPQACRRLSARSKAWPKPPAELRDLVLPALGGRGGLTDGQVPSQENPAPPGGSDCPPTPGLAHAAPRSQRGAGDCRGARSCRPWHLQAGERGGARRALWFAHAPSRASAAGARARGYPPGYSRTPGRISLGASGKQHYGRADIADGSNDRRWARNLACELAVAEQGCRTCAGQDRRRLLGRARSHQHRRSHALRRKVDEIASARARQARPPHQGITFYASSLEPGAPLRRTRELSFLRGPLLQPLLQPGVGAERIRL